MYNPVRIALTVALTTRPSTKKTQSCSYGKVLLQYAKNSQVTNVCRSLTRQFFRATFMHEMNMHGPSVVSPQGSGHYLAYYN
jgi:hypothetical protein